MCHKEVNTSQSLAEFSEQIPQPTKTNKKKEIYFFFFFFLFLFRFEKQEKHFQNQNQNLGLRKGELRYRTSCGVREMRAVSARRGRSGGRRADRVESLRVGFRIIRSGLEKALLEVKRRASAVVALSRSSALLPIVF